MKVILVYLIGLCQWFISIFANRVIFLSSIQLFFLILQSISLRLIFLHLFILFWLQKFLDFIHIGGDIFLGVSALCVFFHFIILSLWFKIISSWYYWTIFMTLCSKEWLENEVMLFKIQFDSFRFFFHSTICVFFLNNLYFPLKLVVKGIFSLSQMK